MKRYAAYIGSMIAGVLILSVSANAGEQTVLKTKSDKDNYATGVEFVRSLQKQAGEVNLDLVIQGMKDALTGEILPFSDDAPNAAFAVEGSKAEGRDAQASTAYDPRQAAAPEEKKAAPAGDTPKLTQPDTQEPRVAMGNKGGAQAPNRSLSVAQRGQDRNVRKLRGLEMRRQAIEQGL